MARRPLVSALNRLASALDVQRPEPARDAVPDDASEMFEGRGGGGGGYGSSLLVNAVSQLGTEQDQSFWNRFATQRTLLQRERFALGRNALTKQALRKVGDTATREPWTVELQGDSFDGETKQRVADKIANYEARLGIPKRAAEALGRGRQYGEAIVLLGIVDGREPDEPVDLDNIETVQWAVVIDRRDFNYEAVGGPGSDDFGKPTLYRINNLDGVLADGVRFFQGGSRGTSLSQQVFEFYGAAGSLVIHADRVLSFATDDALSVLDGMQDVLGSFYEVADGVKRGARDSSLLALKIKDWARKSWHDNGGSKALSRLRAMLLAKSATNAIVMDQTDEDVSQVGSDFSSGLAGAMNPFMVWWAAAIAVPVTVFWGVSPGGFGKGEAERDTWHEEAGAFFTLYLQAELRKLHGYILVAQDGGIGLPADTPRKIIPGDLSPPDEQTRADLRTQAIGDAVTLLENGGMKPPEFRKFSASLASADFPVDIDTKAADADAQQDALVGVWTGVITMLNAVYGEGRVPPEAAAQAAQILGPTRFTSENAQALFTAAPAAAGAQAPTPGEGGGGGLEGLGGIADPEGEEDAAAVAHAAAWEQGREPADTMTSTEIGAALNVSPQRVTAFARKNNIKQWDPLGGRGRYSMSAFQSASMERNDTAPPAKLAIMATIPEEIAAQFADDEERGEPHVTLLYIGEGGAADRDKVLAAAEGVLQGAGIDGLSARFDGVDYFEQPDEDRRVAYAKVAFAPNLGETHKALRAAVDATGFESKHVDKPFTPHATLAYLPPGEDFDGLEPEGEWTPTVELWWGEQRYPLSLAPPLPDPTPTPKE